MWHFVERTTTVLQARLLQAKAELRSEVDAAAARLNAHVAKIAAQAAAWLLAGVLLAVAAGFATAAGYGALLAHFPMEEAAAIMAGVYAALALIAALVAVSMGSADIPKSAAPTLAEPIAGPEAAKPASPTSEGAAAAQAAPAQGQAGGPDPHMPELARIAELLGKVGLTHEQAAVLIASDVAKELSPLQLVAAGLVAGFVVGRKLDV